MQADGRSRSRRSTAPGESSLAAVPGGRMLRNPSTAVGPPQAVRKIDGDDDHQQGQDRIPLTPNSLEL